MSSGVSMDPNLLRQTENEIARAVAEKGAYLGIESSPRADMPYLSDHEYKLFTEGDEADREAMYELSSARETNAYNAKQAALQRDWETAAAKKANEFASREAELNRQYQTMMSNTAYQRAVADLKAAGLNPMLAVNQGGAAATSGATASPTKPSGAAASGAQARASQGVEKGVEAARMLTTLIASIATAASLFLRKGK